MMVYNHPQSEEKVRQARAYLGCPDIAHLRSAHQLLTEIIAAESSVAPDTLLTPAELEALTEGYPINAIKAVRARTGMDLKEAKDLVERAGDKLGLRVLTTDGYRWPERPK